MNVRGLAPTSNKNGRRSGPPSDGLNRATIARARASWGDDKSVSFTDESGIKTPASGRRSSRASTKGSNKGTETGLLELEALVSEAELEAQRRKEEMGEVEEKIRTGELERIPGWQRDLVEIYLKSGGPEWRESSGWPTSDVVPGGSPQLEPEIELYGVMRPFKRQTEVTSLDLSWNNLCGELSSMGGIWNFKSLEILHLGANKLTGIVPTFRQRLLLLKELHLYRNSLHGAIPSDIGDLRHLSSLWLFDNHLQGKIPSSLGNLSGLVDLRLNSNKLTGAIPLSLSGCSNLKTLNLQNNMLDGPIPEDVYTRCIRLRDLRLFNNKLTGPLSPEVSCLRYLEVLMLHENNLSWVIPLTLGACTNLVKLDVSKNNFRGDLPAKVFGTLTKLESCNLSNNLKITGKVPKDLSSLLSLKLLDLSCTGMEELDEFAASVPEGGKLKAITEGFSRII